MTKKKDLLKEKDRIVLTKKSFLFKKIYIPEERQNSK